VKIHFKKSPEDIYEIFAKGGEVKANPVVFTPEKFGVTKEFVMQYIVKLQNAYASLDN